MAPQDALGQRRAARPLIPPALVWLYHSLAINNPVPPAKQGYPAPREGTPYMMPAAPLGGPLCLTPAAHGLGAAHAGPCCVPSGL